MPLITVSVSIFAAIQSKRFNDKINCVMLRTLLSEAMNESPISTEDRQVCVSVCVCGYRSLFGVKPVPNWLATFCLWRDPLRYDYQLPRPHSQAS